MLAGLGFMWVGGCDSVPTPNAEEQQPPRVSGLQIVIDSVQVVEEDSLAEIVLGVATRATDPDGEIDRVVSIIEPASTPQAVASAELQQGEGTIYVRRIGLTVPLVRDIYTVRVFAVGNDSLTSNQVTGQFRFDPDGGIQISGIESRATGTRSPHVPLAARPRLSTVSDHQRP